MDQDLMGVEFFHIKDNNFRILMKREADSENGKIKKF